MGCFQLHEYQRQAVYEANQISTAVVDFAGDPELLRQEVLVVFGIGPVNYAHSFHMLNVINASGDFHAVLQ